jgi:uncharacterized membrane protein HdeD (DUF308 family)
MIEAPDFSREEDFMADAMTADRTERAFTDWPGWDYLPGIAFLAIGILALFEPPYASLGASIYLGAMLCVAGGFMTVGGIANLNRGAGWLALLLGLLGLATGAIVLYNPTAGAVSLAWVLGIYFIIGGVLELAAAFSIPVGRGWLILIGIINIAAGVFVVMMDPKQAFSFLGYFVGISLVFRGSWAMFFTADLHTIQRSII